MFRLLLSSLALITLNSCVSLSGGQSIDSALLKVANPTSYEAGVEALTTSCEKGLSGACALIGKPTEAKSPIPILQSVTSDSQSRIVIQIEKTGSLFFVRSIEDSKNPSKLIKPAITEHNYRGSAKSLVHLDVQNLDPKEQYELLVLDSRGHLVDMRTFKSLALNKKRVRIAVASCMDDSFKDEQAEIWKQVISQKPDVVLMIGDNTYASRGSQLKQITPTAIWKRYEETRELLAFFYAKELIPVLAVWDDHDYGMNNGDRTFAYKDDMQKIFYSFFDQKEPVGAFTRGPGIASWWNAFGVQFAFLDDRTFRSPDSEAEQTHFGVEQEKWLNQHLALAKEPVFIISGDQFFGAYSKFESYEGSHPRSFQNQLGEWKKTRAPILFVSGDRHLTEIIKVPASALGYATFELTSSGIHAKVYPDAFKQRPNPNQLVGQDGQHNYMMVELMQTSQNSIQLNVQSFGHAGKLHFQKTLSVRRK